MPPHGSFQPFSVEPDPILRVIPFWKMDQTCRGLGAVARLGDRIVACQSGNTIYLPSGVSPEFDQCLNRHEEAHRHGWPADHPRAIFETGESP
jgi:hypothetical protein